MTHFQCHWLFVNMPFTKEDNTLIKNLFELKGCNARHLVRIFQKKQKCQQRLQIVAIAMDYWLVDRRPGSGRWCSTHIDLFHELVLKKNGLSRNNSYLHTVLNYDLIIYKILSKLVVECWRYSKPKQCHFWAWLKRPIFWVHFSQGSAETLVRRGEIAHYHLIVYFFSNISAKNYQNRLMCIEVIVWKVSVVFLRYSVLDLRFVVHRSRSKVRFRLRLGLSNLSIVSIVLPP